MQSTCTGTSTWRLGTGTCSLLVLGPQYWCGTGTCLIVEYLIPDCLLLPWALSPGDVSKVIERAVPRQLHEYLTAEDLLPRCQSAYRKQPLTETVMLRVLSDALTTNDDRQVSLITLLDLSSAFDCVDHELLLRRLQYNFAGWRRSFGRNMFPTTVSCRSFVQYSSEFHGGPSSAPCSSSCMVHCRLEQGYRSQ